MILACPVFRLIKVISDPSSTLVFYRFELIADSPNRTRLDVNLQRADGLPAASLYYRNTYTRIGIRKTVDLWTTDSVVKEREEIEKQLEEEDRRTGDARRGDVRAGGPRHVQCPVFRHRQALSLSPAQSPPTPGLACRTRGLAFPAA